MKFEAAILDLDGVLTDTAALHERAWKQVFDAELAAAGQPPFSHGDYRAHVDGRPREDGVLALLAARGLDAPDDRVRDIAERKNRAFHALLDAEGPALHADAVACVRRWRDHGVGIGIVSSSRNAAAVIARAGLADLVDVRVDGTFLDRMAGKPAPDLFLEAARRLDVAPSDAWVFEDAQVGVEAGRRGRFACVVGVDREGRGLDADRVIRSFDDLPDLDARLRRPAALPSAFGVLDRLTGRVAVFLDYDGTLSPIVPDPEHADLSPSMREAVAQLAARVPVAVVSGRDRADVARRVGIPDIWTAGSHGFDIQGPGGHLEHPAGLAAVPVLDRVEAALRERLRGIDGAIVERKRFSLAVHYRMVPDDRIPDVLSAVDDALDASEGLRRAGGKRVVELRPDVDWDKGRAVAWLLDALSLRDAVPVYVGDDRTDEDAFDRIRDRGVGVLVDAPRRPTLATARLDDTDQVETWLRQLAALRGPGVPV